MSMQEYYSAEQMGCEKGQQYSNCGCLGWGASLPEGDSQAGSTEVLA